MTGYPDMNFPMFNKVEAWLKSQGISCFNPAKNGQGKKSYEWYLKRDLKDMLMCDGLFILPEWEGSNGAGLETYVSRKLKMPMHLVGLNECGEIKLLGTLD